MGLSGLGDLVLTASSLTSRNTAFGYALGQGRGADLAAGARKRHSPRASGRPAPPARWRAGRAWSCRLSEAVRAVVAGEVPLEGAIEGLLARPVPGSE